MNLAGLITFWALVLAAYSLLPEYWKLKLRVVYGFRPVIITWLFTSSLIIWAMFDDSDSQFTKVLQVVAYGYLGVFIWDVFLQLNKRKIPKEQLATFRDLVAQLLQERSHPNLTKLLDENLLTLSNFWKDSNDTTTHNYVYQVIALIVGDSAFKHYVAIYRVNVAIKLVTLFEDSYEIAEWSDELLEVLITETASPLFTEIRLHQNGGWSNKRQFAGSELLEFLFQDPTSYQDRELYRPIGETITSLIRERVGSIDDSYNRSSRSIYPSWQEKQRFSEPVFIGIEFFDFLIRESLLEQIPWHMWLYYLGFWCDELVEKIIFIDKEWEGPNDGYPTPYSYLLAQIVYYQLHWFFFVQSKVIDSISTQTPVNPNDDILKATSVTLSRCLRAICSTEQLPFSFKRSLLTSWWHTYYELRRLPSLINYADDMFVQLKNELYHYLWGWNLNLLSATVSGFTHADEIGLQIPFADRTAMKQILSDMVIEVIDSQMADSSLAELDRVVLLFGEEYQLVGSTVQVRSRVAQWEDVASIQTNS